MSNDEKLEYPDFSGLLEIANSLKTETEMISTVKELTTDGIIVKLKDLSITYSGIFNLFDDGTIKKVALYIDEDDRSRVEKESGPQYHLFLCHTIKNYQYLQSTSPKSARKFRIYRGKTLRPPLNKNKRVVYSTLQKKEPEKEMTICPFCLRRYFSLINKEFGTDEFNLKEFFNTDSYEKEKDFIHDYDQIPGFYEKSWPHLATLSKVKNNYKCEKCSIELNRHYLQKFLNAHYIGTTIKDKRIDKIKTLCIKCHAEEKDHQGIKQTPNYKEFIELLNKRDNS